MDSQQSSSDLAEPSESWPAILITQARVPELLDRMFRFVPSTTHDQYAQIVTLYRTPARPSAPARVLGDADRCWQSAKSPTRVPRAFGMESSLSRALHPIRCPIAFSTSNAPVVVASWLGHTMIKMDMHMNLESVCRCIA